jgi:hypothetical protein
MSHRPISSRAIEKTKPRIATSGRPTYRGVDRQNLPPNHKADAVIRATISEHRNQDEARPGRERYSRHDRRQRRSGPDRRRLAAGQVIGAADINHQNIARCAFEFGTAFFQECATPLYAILTRETFGHRTVNCRPVLAVPIALSQFDSQSRSPVCSLRIQETSRRRFRLSRTSGCDRSSYLTDVGSAYAMPRRTMPSCD